MRGRSRAARILVFAALGLLVIGLPDPARSRQQRSRYPAGPDVSEVLSSLEVVRLPPPAAVLYISDVSGLDIRARNWQIALQEARSFYRSLLGVAPDIGLLLVDSSVWAALLPDRWYGFPSVTVSSRQDGLLAMLAIETGTTFSEEAVTAVRVAPLAHRGMLLARDAGTEAGAARYAESWVWIQFAEGMVADLRIGSQSWWQTRLAGMVAAWMFLESPRGQELVPGATESLEAWSWFWRQYLNPIAVELTAANRTPPAGDPREALELNARLLAMGRAIWQEYGPDAFTRLRRAWPHDADFESIREALDSLWEAMPEMEPWESTLLTPRSP
jgi:hypothetical protein